MHEYNHMEEGKEHEQQLSSPSDSIQWYIDGDLEREAELPQTEVDKQVQEKLEVIKRAQQSGIPSTIFLWGPNLLSKYQDDFVLAPTKLSPYSYGSGERKISLYPPAVDTSFVSARAFVKLKKRLGVEPEQIPDSERAGQGREGDLTRWGKVLPTRFKGVFYHENHDTYAHATDQHGVFVTVNANYRNAVSKSTNESNFSYLLRRKGIIK